MLSEYALNRDEYSFKNLFWGTCTAHFKLAISNELTFGRRIVHGLIALSQLCPGIGQIAALIEMIAVKLFHQFPIETKPNLPVIIPQEPESIENSEAFKAIASQLRAANEELTNATNELANVQNEIEAHKVSPKCIALISVLLVSIIGLEILAIYSLSFINEEFDNLKSKLDRDTTFYNNRLAACNNAIVQRSNVISEYYSLLLDKIENCGPPSTLCLTYEILKNRFQQSLHNNNLMHLLENSFKVEY